MHGMDPRVQPTAVPFERQIIANIKFDILQGQRQMLTNNIFPDRHLDFLRSKYLLSEDDCEEIMAQTTRRRRASKFLDFLATKGPDGYDMFLEALRQEGTQMFILEALNKDYEARYRNYQALIIQKPCAPHETVIYPPQIVPPPPPRHSYQEPMEHHFMGLTPPVSPSSGTGSTFYNVSSCPVSPHHSNSFPGQKYGPLENNLRENVEKNKDSSPSITILELLHSMSNQSYISTATSSSRGDLQSRNQKLSSRGLEHDFQFKFSPAGNIVYDPSVVNNGQSTPKSPVSATDIFLSLPQSYVEKGTTSANDCVAPDICPLQSKPGSHETLQEEMGAHLTVAEQFKIYCMQSKTFPDTTFIKELYESQVNCPSTSSSDLQCHFQSVASETLQNVGHGDLQRVTHADLHNLIPANFVHLQRVAPEDLQGAPKNLLNVSPEDLHSLSSGDLQNASLVDLENLQSKDLQNTSSRDLQSVPPEILQNYSPDLQSVSLEQMQSTYLGDLKYMSQTTKAASSLCFVQSSKLDSTNTIQPSEIDLTNAVQPKNTDSSEC